MPTTVLIAGIGNLFLRDDGFGPEVVRRLAAADDLPDYVLVVDYGIRGMHLAYDLLDGYAVSSSSTRCRARVGLAMSRSSRSARATWVRVISIRTAWRRSRC